LADKPKSKVVLSKNRLCLSGFFLIEGRRKVFNFVIMKFKSAFALPPNPLKGELANPQSKRLVISKDETIFKLERTPRPRQVSLKTKLFDRKIVSV
jgi:hypothetical protein